MTMDIYSLYWVLITAGFLLIAAEFFIPGGILGAVGTLALLAAIITGFSAFGAQTGLISAFGIMVGGTAFLFLWIKYCPHSILGKWFTLQESGKEFKSYDDTRQELVGRTGAAQTDLRPSGIALIDGKRVDVVSEAGFIPHGTPVKVILVAGTRVVVRETEEA